MEQIKGIVKSIKQDKKGIKLDNDKWYSNNYKSEVECEVGDEVEIKFKVNGIFNNYDTIEVLKKATGASQVSNKSFNPVSTICRQATDVAIALISDKKTMKFKVSELIDDHIIAYLKAERALNDPDGYIEDRAKETQEDPEQVITEKI